VPGQTFAIRPALLDAKVGDIVVIKKEFSITSSNIGLYTNAWAYGCGIEKAGATGSAYLYDFVINEGSEALPHGYKLPITVTSNGTTTDYPIYIGDSQLMEGEYVDYESGKVYKRTENLWNPNTPFTEGMYVLYNGMLSMDSEWRASDYIDINSNEQYTFSVNTTAGQAAYHVFYDSNMQRISAIKSGTQTFITPNNATYARFSYRKTTTEIVLVKGSAVPSSYIPYLQPTDPPVPLPDIALPQGEVTIDAEEEIKPQATIKGKIKQIT
jgi:hypothetical protein